MKRSPGEKHTQTHGSLIKMFRGSQMSFPIKRVNVCEHTVKMTPREGFGKMPSERVRDRKGVGVEGWNEI